MIIRRESLKAALACAGDGTDMRYAFNQVQVRPDGTCIATDGQILVYVREPHHRFPDEDFPIVRGEVEKLTELTQPANIPRGMVDRLIAGTPKKTSIPVLQCVRVGEDATLRPYAVSTDLQVPTVVSLAEQTTDHPLPAGIDKSMVQKGERASVSMTLSVIKLKQLIAVAEATKGGQSRSAVCVTFEIPTDPQYQFTVGGVPDGRVNSQIRFTTGGGEITAEGVVMPMVP